MTELAIALGIIGLVLGAICVAAKSVMDSNCANQAVQDIYTMAAVSYFLFKYPRRRLFSHCQPANEQNTPWKYAV